MGEPVTTGMMIGAALGGGTAAIKGGNPLQGALMGGLTGAAGGAFTGGAMGAAGTPASGIMGTGAGFAGNNLAAAPTFMQQLGGGVTGVGVTGVGSLFELQAPKTRVVKKLKIKRDCFMLLKLI